MPGYSTSPSGVAAAGASADKTIRDAKAGSPLGTSGTYSDAPNAAQPSTSTIARNEENKASSTKPAGSTSDTGRKMP